MDGRCVCHTSFSYRAQNNIPSFPTLQSISKTTQNRRLFSFWHCRKSSWSSNVLTIYFHRFGDNLKGALVGRISIPYVLIIPPTSRLLSEWHFRPDQTLAVFFIYWPSCPPGSEVAEKGKNNFQENSIAKTVILETWQTNNYQLWSGPSFQTLFTTSHLQQRSTASKKIVRIAQCPTRLHFLSSSRVPFYPITPLFLSLLLMLHVEGGGGGGRAPLEIFTSSSLLSTPEAPFFFFFQEGGEGGKGAGIGKQQP